MVEAWTTVSQNPIMITLMDANGVRWVRVALLAHADYTEYMVFIDPTSFKVTIPTVYFPLQWTRVCVSLDTDSAKVSFNLAWMV